ncbi:hypothetical protein HPP92_023622 [Vanilla planifolia]|uniref:Uncharacterized protein n=1 Tax=Vanilla planifolia TaxID=51239 RepID=A0A835PQP8_VANPL|nr:hypothetical protein HPP92_023622 [Vanilla planifolia]
MTLKSHAILLVVLTAAISWVSFADTHNGPPEEGSGSSPWQRPLPSVSPPPHGGDLPPYLGPLPIDYVCFPFYGGETDLVCRSFCESRHYRQSNGYVSDI